MAFEIPQMAGKPITSLENLSQCSVAKVFPAVQREPPVFHIVLIASGPVTGRHWKEPSSTFLAPSPQMFIDIDEIPLSCVFSRLRSPSSLSISSKEGCSSPFNFVTLCWSLQYVYFSLILENWIQHSCGLTSTDHFGTDSLAETFDRQLHWDSLSYHKDHLLLFKD